jgi:hypothetical protein
MPNQGVHDRIGVQVRDHADEQASCQESVGLGRMLGLETDQGEGVLAVCAMQPVGQTFQRRAARRCGIEQGIMKNRAKEQAVPRGEARRVAR